MVRAALLSGFLNLGGLICGRMSLFIPLDDLVSRFDGQYVVDGGYQPRLYIAPHQSIEVIPKVVSYEFDQCT